MLPAAMSNNSSVSTPEEKEHDKIKEDKISELPDDTLISILSRLGMKEATKTSILSRRWRYLSTNLSSLDFDGSDTMEEYWNQHKSIEIEKPRFLTWVNQVISLHHGSSIIDFRVCFRLNETQADHIDNWVKFAFSKRVKNLEFDLSFMPAIEVSSDPYTLERVLKGTHCDNDFSFLTSLSLKKVNISQESLESLLSRCHHLERLFLEQSHELVHLKVINSSRRLKYLAIHYCWKLDKLEIDAVNLESFEFMCSDKRMEVVYHNVPSLVEAKFGGEYYCKGLFPNFWEIACFSKHLTKLSLNMHMIREDAIIPSFDNVKHLELVISVRGRHKSLLALRCFAEACPLLHEFKLQVYWLSYDESEYKRDSEKYNLEHMWRRLETQTEDGFSCTLPHLHKLEWVGGFSGRVVAELWLALYIVKNANNLEKFICDPRHPLLVGKRYEFEDMKWIEASRRHARQLAKIIPSSVDLVII